MSSHPLILNKWILIFWDMHNSPGSLSLRYRCWSRCFITSCGPSNTFGDDGCSLQWCWNGTWHSPSMSSSTYDVGWKCLYFCRCTSVFSRIRRIRGGGNSNIVYFQPDPWGNDPIWRSYFSNGLVQPPTRIIECWTLQFVRGEKVEPVWPQGWGL